MRALREPPRPSLVPRRSRREKNLPTEQARSEAPSRLSRTDGDGRWPQGDCRAPRPRPQAPVRLSSVRAVTDGARRPPTSSGETSSPPDTKTRRLRKRPDFLAASQGRRFHTERLTAQGRLRDPGETRDGAPAAGLYVGFTITKRVGHATERNRIRRRLRRAVEIATQTGSASAADVVVIARRPALDTGFETLVNDLRKALSVVTKPRAIRQGDAPGDRARDAAHSRGPAKPAPPSPQPMTEPHGTTDG